MGGGIRVHYEHILASSARYAIYIQIAFLFYFITAHIRGGFQLCPPDDSPPRPPLVAQLVDKVEKLKNAQNVMGSPKSALKFFRTILLLTRWGGGGVLSSNFVHQMCHQGGGGSLVPTLSTRCATREGGGGRGVRSTRCATRGGGGVQLCPPDEPPPPHRT